MAVGASVGDGVAEDWRDCVADEPSDSSDVMDSWVELAMELCPVLVEEELLVENESLVAEGWSFVKELAVVMGLLALVEEADRMPDELTSLVNFP